MILGVDIMLKLIDANNKYLDQYKEAYSLSLKQIKLGNNCNRIKMKRIHQNLLHASEAVQCT